MLKYDTDSSTSSSTLEDELINADLGDPTSQYNVGIYFHSGFQVSRCYTRALHFFVLAARQGHAKAMHMIGICYKYGEGVSVDNNFAIQWFIFSSSSGNNRANYDIGFMYYHGYGVAQSYSSAEYYLNLGIQNGDTYGIPLYNKTIEKLNS